ncbi:hypothetical protein N7509_000807 [Penicillium cosmopolitanum]|uniref:Uncharacterized protein n=1 Tax=Penicillium cosmopolitanum TaxID=1131564 RepID=A0A9W9WB67_9EURO|nr:uncharacterized protein N7509_000807 [Penicillium cosmopolitanum]KAJ5414180.1 hypothetical protein N7509_000807 [Penicillium cosmopolitanum]
MEKLDRPEQEWLRLLILPRSLVSIGIKSAVKSLEILSDEGIILETFLPFDLEFTFSAALYLTIAHAVFQFDNEEQHHTETAHRIFEQLVSGGNRVAEVRIAELTHMQFLFQEFSKRIEQQGAQSLTLSNAPEKSVSSGMDIVEEQGNPAALEWSTASEEDSESFSLTQDPLAQGPYCLEAIGISSNEFLAIVDQISAHDIAHGILDPQPECQIAIQNFI